MGVGGRYDFSFRYAPLANGLSSLGFAASAFSDTDTSSISRYQSRQAMFSRRRPFSMDSLHFVNTLGDGLQSNTRRRTGMQHSRVQSPDKASRPSSSRTPSGVTERMGVGREANIGASAGLRTRPFTSSGHQPRAQRQRNKNTAHKVRPSSGGVLSSAGERGDLRADCGWSAAGVVGGHDDGKSLVAVMDGGGRWKGRWEEDKRIS